MEARESRFGVHTPDGLMLSMREFKSLPEYSSTLPTGTIIGKRWRRFTDIGWYMGEYIASSKPGMIGIEWTKILLPEEARDAR